MHVGNSNDLAAHFLSELHIELVDQLLLGNPIIAYRKVQMVAVKNLVQRIHVFARLAVATRRNVLPVAAKEVARDSDKAFLVLVHHLKRHRGNFGPAVAFFVAVTHDAEQVVIALLILDKQGQAFKSRRVLLARARGIHVNMAAVNGLYRREPLFLALLVQVLAAGLDFQDTEHGSMVRKGDRRGVIRSSGVQDAVETCRRL